MGTRSGPIERARRRSDDDERRVRRDIGSGRRAAGLSQEAVGRACGISGSAEGRIENGTTRSVDLRLLACLGAAVGLDVRLRSFPAGDPIRDAGQIRLLERFRRRLHPSVRWSTEVPLPIEGDLRAWDVLIRGPDWRLPVDAETVLDDLQALERRLHLKQRDSGGDHILLLVADTARNRRALAAAPGSFADLPLRTRDVLRAVGAGTDPGASGIVIL